MLKLTVNGKPMATGDLGTALKMTTISAAGNGLRERIAAIRHPETGEFPTVVIRGEELHDLRWTVEASPELLEIVRQQLPSEDMALLNMTSINGGTPHAFLSFAFHDEKLAEKIAHAMQAKGIDTWWAPWSTTAGDSLPTEINRGLQNATHFVVLLTEASLKSKWVHQEMDAAMVQKLASKVRFIPLRSGIKVDALPPLLQPMLSPSVDNFDDGIEAILSAVHELSKKPPLGPAPAAASHPKTGQSPAASAIAKHFVLATTHGVFGDPQITELDLAAATGLATDDVTDALFEMRDHLQQSFDRVFPRDTLFANFDGYWQAWTPADDALLIAASLINDDSFPKSASEIAAKFDWPARRLNPALAYLLERQLLIDHKAIGTAPFIMHWVSPNDSTRRFVKSRS